MNLDKLRQNIDEVDQELTKLLEKRMTLVNQISALKKANGAATRDAAREERILSAVRAQVHNPDFADPIAATYQDILKQSRAYQDKQKSSK